MYQNIKSGTIGKIFNATIENPSSNSLGSEIQLVILLPSDFTNVADVTAGADNWNVASIVQNPDDSTVITVDTTTNPFTTGNQTYQFSADVPILTNNKLYVFQTTTIYPSWTDGIQLSSALSEAGVQVVP